VEVLGTRPRLA